jgi:protein Tex
MLDLIARIATDIHAKPEQVRAAVELIDGGATVPFIARYRKEATGGLDDTQLRGLEERLIYLRELNERREAILKSIDEQGKLNDALRAEILGADSKARLEDLYLPYKPKRRTKAEIAREAGLEPLADGLLNDPARDPSVEAAAFVAPDRGIADVKAALDGAKSILVERFAEDPALVGELREWLWSNGQIVSTLIEGKDKSGAKFADYFSHAEPLGKAPSHRVLALLRARNEGVIDLVLAPLSAALKFGVTPTDEQLSGGHAFAEGRIATRFGVAERGRAADGFLRDAVRQAWRHKLHVHLSLDLIGRAREAAETEAIRVFSANLKDLMLAAPAGRRVVLGIDPGIRTGCKYAVVDRTGKVVETATIYPHAPKFEEAQSLARLAMSCRSHGVELIAIGNGTASRETDELVAKLIGANAELKLAKVLVSEAGASVYSASEVAAKEFPELDVSLRGAVSIARRLQDPLAELVKIDPKAIGVGQYQHDVNQIRLGSALDARVEDCVNAVGVDLNTASGALLARVAGLSAGVAENIVKFRDANGAFANRQAVLNVPRLGPKAFEQAAGFLRISDGDNPLDASAVHPEAYPLIERILARCGRPIEQVIGDAALLKSLDANVLTDAQFGLPTVRDVLRELEKPGRDPRGEFKTARFTDGVNAVTDLKPGMVLEGVVTNVANFGAFVDIGVHQDGLVHISALGPKFVKDPREVVKAGQIVKVRVVEIDLARKRIALTMKLDERIESKQRSEHQPTARPDHRPRPDPRREEPKRPATSAPAPFNNAFAEALAKAQKRS